MKRFLHITHLLLFAVCIAAIVLGVLLRLVEAANGNYVFGFDQGLDIMAARSIAYDHKLTLIGSEAGAGFAGLPGIFHGPGYHYLLAVVLLLSRGNPYGSIVFLSALSLVALYGLFRLSKMVFGEAVGRAVLMLSAVSLPLTAQARMIWAPNFSGIIAVPFLYVLWASRKKTYSAIFLSTFLAACLYHFEIPMAVPAIVATCLYFIFVLHIRDVRRWTVAMGGVVVGFLPMILFESRHGWGVVKGIFLYGSRLTQSAQAKPFLPVAEFIGDTNALLSTIRESFIFTIPWAAQIFPLLLLSSAVYYVYHEKNKEMRHFMTALLLLIGAHMIVYYPYRGPVYSHYFSLLYVVYPILAAYTAIRALQGRMSRWVIYGFGTLLLFSVLTKFPKTIAYDYQDYGGTAKIRGKIDAIDSIYEHAAGTGFNLLVFTPPVYTYAYDYLLNWYALRKYGYIPGRLTSGTVYLLIEPDPEKPWSYNGWLETVIKHGDVIASWRLPSGFIIEKRFIREQQ